LRVARRGPVVAIAAIAALVVGASLLARSLRGPEAGSERRPGAASIQSSLPRLSAFVERERGLRFRRPLRVTVLAGPAFEAALVASGAPDPTEIETTQALLRALGLLRPGQDLRRIVADADREGALGFYSAEERELVVRGGGGATPLVRRTLVHELTHALDDQHFGLERDFDSDEAATGWESLIEGSAVRIERRYVESLSSAEQREIRSAEQAQLESRGDVPPLVELSLGFPYVYGPELVERLLRSGGRTRLDAAFASPPVSSEQVIDPSRYLLGDRPLAVPRPAPDGPVFDEGEVGQLLLTLLLQSRLDEATALEAAAGWGGDRYVAWRQHAATCIRMAFVMDTPADSRELRAAFSEWTTRRPGATASGTSLTTCA
jgi:hypothetical protein